MRAAHAIALSLPLVGATNLEPNHDPNPTISDEFYFSVYSGVARDAAVVDRDAVVSTKTNSAGPTVHGDSNAGADGIVYGGYAGIGIWRQQCCGLQGSDTCEHLPGLRDPPSMTTAILGHAGIGYVVTWFG